MEQPDENIPAIEPSEQATPQRQSKRTKKRERLKILKELSHFFKRRLKPKVQQKCNTSELFWRDERWTNQVEGIHKESGWIFQQWLQWLWN